MVHHTADTEEEMDEAPATPSPNVSDDSNMETDEEAELLAYTGEGRDGDDSSDEVPARLNIGISVHRAV